MARWLPAVSRGMTSDRTDWTGVAFGIALACLVAFQQFKLPPVLPSMLATYGWDRTLAGGFMSVYAVAGLALSIAVGRRLQRKGPMGALLAAFALLLLGNLLTLLDPASGALVLLARGLEGIAFAIGAIAGPAIAYRSANPRHMGFVVGLAAGWIPVGQLLASGFSWLLSAWQGLWLVAMAMTVLMGAWSLALRHHESFAHPAGSTAGARSRPTARQRWQLLMVAGIFLLWSMQYFGFMTWLPQYLVEIVHLGAGQAALGYALPVAVLLGFNVLTGILLGAGLPLGPLLALALTSQAAVWWLIPGIHGQIGGISLLIVYGIGAGITPTCLFALPAVLLGRAGAPTAYAFVMTGRNIGVLLGPVLLAEVTKQAGGWTLVWPLFGSTTALTVLAALALAATLGRAHRPSFGAPRSP